MRRWLILTAAVLSLATAALAGSVADHTTEPRTTEAARLRQLLGTPSTLEAVRAAAGYDVRVPQYVPDNGSLKSVHKFGAGAVLNYGDGLILSYMPVQSQPNYPVHLTRSLRRGGILILVDGTTGIAFEPQTGQAPRRGTLARGLFRWYRAGVEIQIMGYYSVAELTRMANTLA